VERSTRTALWEHAGIERSPTGLARLLEDPHPLARMVARSALAREESRGTHTRTDHPERDARLERMHAVASRDGAQLDWQAWD
jgi:succinate dehydrogenase/fumarate reductase flavoprotein subunit